MFLFLDISVKEDPFDRKIVLDVVGIFWRGECDVQDNFL